MKRRLSNKEQKKLADDARLLRTWKKFHREERETVLAGPHGSVLNELFRMLANLKHVQPAQLIGYVQSIDWTAIDYNTKLVVVHECNSAITAYREKHNSNRSTTTCPAMSTHRSARSRQSCSSLPLIRGRPPRRSSA
jgi:hypothetical protein